ncbi:MULTISPECIES: RDD family protein [unclassified Sphingobacterium]|uniref:RDD family protein n=1 Tax=unclassified Sphingobacterium TaxID=2609468 RepID=UPI0025EBB519|nr:MULTISPECIES: RDD family protein [unclassified Sphingobacterium]
MLVIFGTKSVGKTVKTGEFECARCNTQRTYQLKQNQRFFSLFFIPIIPLGKLGDTLECTFCKTAYIPSTVLPASEYTSSTAVIDSLEAPLASAGKRFGSYLIDMVVLTLLNFPLAFLSKLLPDYFDNKFYLLFFPLWILYFFLMELLFKGTIGKKALSIKIISDNEGSKLSVFQYFVRSIVKCIPVLPIILLFNDKRKAAHDMIAGTIVVEK